MEIEQNWQNYRSIVKEKAAIFSVNLSLFQTYQETQATHHTIKIFAALFGGRKRVATSGRLSTIAQRNVAPFDIGKRATAIRLCGLYAFR